MASRARPNALATASGWAFVLFAAAALGHGLWSIYFSGAPLSIFDLRSAESPSPAAPEPGGTSRPTRFGPLALSPAMNPLRFDVRATFAPVGSSRIRYEIAMVAEHGARVWEKRGALGTTGDEASVVSVRETLKLLDLERPGRYFVEVRFEDGSMDDLREANLHVRRNVARVNVVFLSGLALLAAASLIVSLVASRKTPWHDGAGS